MEIRELWTMGARQAVQPPSDTRVIDCRVQKQRRVCLLLPGAE